MVLNCFGDAMSKIIKIVFLIAGCLLLLNACFLFFVVNFNLGLLALFLVSTVFILFGFFFEKVSKIRFIPIFVYCMTFLFVLFSVSIFLYGSHDTVCYDEDAVIVLGAGIRGEKVSKSLAFRLDAAIKFHKKNPDAMIIVSGGQGKQEVISEALAMERYLIANGVNPEKIIKEDRSTSTIENFRFSIELLDEYFSKDCSVAFITNDFHILRAELVAKSAGIDVTHLSASTTWYTVPMIYMREAIAYIKYFLL